MATLEALSSSSAQGHSDSTTHRTIRFVRNSETS